MNEEPNTLDPNQQEDQMQQPRSSTPLQKLSKARNLTNHLYRGAKKAGKAVKKALQVAKKIAVNIAKIAATHPVATAIVCIVFALLIIIIMIINNVKEEYTTKAINDSAKSVIENWDANNLTEQQEQAKVSFEKTGSLLDFSLSDITSMKDALERSVPNDGSELKSVYDSLLTKEGEDTFYPQNRVVSPNESVTLYEHMLLISKYDFNNVKWKQYGHGHDGNDSPMKDDIEMGVKYPSDQNDTKFKTFSALLRPYLVSHEIPIAFFSGLIDDTYSEIQGDIKFPYAICKYGLSDITVNRYDVQTYNLVTYYLEYDATNYQSCFDIKITQNSNGSYSVSFSNLRSRQIGDTTNVNTGLGDDGNHDVMKETKIDEQSGASVENVYYVADAKIWDMKLNTEYKYVKYSEDDVRNRVMWDTENYERTPYVETINEGNKLTSLPGNISYNVPIEAIISSIQTNYGGTITLTNAQNGTYTFVKNGTYEERSGEKIYATRVWKDRLSQSKKETKMYTIEDVIEYNKNNPYGSISEDEFKSDSTSYDYYKKYENEEKLNRIDFFNSNPNIYKTYISKQFGFSKYIGIRRESLNDFPYNNLIQEWTELKDKNKTFPYIYGKSLGFGGSSSERNSLYGMNLLREYINTFEGDGSFEGGGRFDENYQKVNDNKNAKYYKVYDAHDGVHTVGYGVNMEANRDAFEAIGIDVSTVSYGDFLEKDIIDKIEDLEIQEKLDIINPIVADLGLKEFQIHALCSHCYLAGNINGFLETFKSSWNQDTDLKYDELKEKYKDNTENVSAIQDEIDFGHRLYTSWFNHYNNNSPDGGGRYPGWVTRERSEFTLFQSGYYSTLKMFWGAGGEGTPNGIAVSDGSAVNESGVIELQVWFEDNLFSGRIDRANTDPYSSSWQNTVTDLKNSDSRGYLNSEYADLYRTAYIYQCPWWSYFRGALYFSLVGRDDLAQVLKGCVATGHGKDAADYAAGYLHIESYKNDSIDNIEPYSIISFDDGSECGHTAFVEGVADDYIILSDCGSGTTWAGVHAVSKATLSSRGNTYSFKNSICLAHALENN